MGNAYLQKLRQAIEIKCGCGSAHVGLAHVHESKDGRTVWKGLVEIFALRGHATAQQAFAWEWTDVGGNTSCLVMLRLPPIHTAAEAVSSAIASGMQGPGRPSW